MRLFYKLALTIVLLGLLAMLTPISVAVAADEVNFPDAVLREAIREAIGGGDITQDKLNLLTYFRYDTYQQPAIQEITGIEHCTSLTSLSLDFNQISDISQLTGLTNLMYLSLDYNKITDISPLTGLTSLTELSLFANRISDMSPLAGLTNLTSLVLSGNQISDLSLLSGLTNLTRLELMGCHISDISAIAALSNLVYLNFYVNEISDISPLAGLTNLSTLDLCYNQVSDISPLSGLTNLTDLRLRYIGLISDISPLAGLTKLQELFLDQNQISDISPLIGLTNLSTLILGYNHISDISPLGGLTNLTLLDLSNNQISDISPLGGLTNLTTLTLDGNQISNISLLAGLTNLTSLGLSSNQIINISPLAGLTNLTLLDLSHTRIFNLTPLAGLSNITYLSLSFNAMGDIASLAGLTNLQYLDLHWTNVTDIKALVDNAGLSTGDYIDLRTTNLNPVSIYEYIPQLQARGVTVDYNAPSNKLPNQPTNVSPTNGATDISLTPTLQSSAFSDPDVGDTHGASQWQIRTSTGSYSSALWDSGKDTTNLTSITVPSGNLESSTNYYWHVRYQDNLGAWSEYSDETSFTTTSGPAQHCYQVNTGTGTGVATLCSNLQSIDNVMAYSSSVFSPQAIANMPNLQFIHGFFSFRTYVPTYGQSTTLTLTLPSKVPVGTQYWKYGPTPSDPADHWYQIPMGDNDGDNVVTITLVDGGLGDDDLTANGVIIDQGGPGNPPQQPGGGAVGGGVPVFPNIYIGIAAALGAGVLAYFVRRRLVRQE